MRLMQIFSVGWVGGSPTSLSRRQCARPPRSLSRCSMGRIWSSALSDQRPERCISQRPRSKPRFQSRARRRPSARLRGWLGLSCILRWIVVDAAAECRSRFAPAWLCHCQLFVQLRTIVPDVRGMAAGGALPKVLFESFAVHVLKNWTVTCSGCGYSRRLASLAPDATPSRDSG
jgi:hypothetical protein